MIKPKHRFEAEIAELRQEISKLSHLIPYARHRSECRRGPANGWLCTCGFDKVVDQFVK